MKNVFYFQMLYKIGGIETFFYYLAKKYKNKDITIYYRVGDPKQVQRLQQYVRVKQWEGEEIECERAFFCFNLDIIQHVHAKEYYQIEHGDYKAMKILPNTAEGLKYIGCSQNTCDTFHEVTGHEIELCYNPVMVDKPKKVLHLISAMRIEKGKGLDRILKLASMFKFPYTWEIYCDRPEGFTNPNIICRPARLDIIDFIADADYLVQLSDYEGYCYSVVEALCVGTPVIVSDIPVFHELGVNDTNGFILKKDLSNADPDAIYKGKKGFTYTPKKDRWDEFLAKGRSTYKPQEGMQWVTVKLTYMDMRLKKQIPAGEELWVTAERAEQLRRAGVV